MEWQEGIHGIPLPIKVVWDAGMLLLLVHWRVRETARWSRLFLGFAMISGTVALLYHGIALLWVLTGHW